MSKQKFIPRDEDRDLFTAFDGLDDYNDGLIRTSHNGHVHTGNAPVRHFSCYETHEPLPITVNGKTYKVYGGSCGNPIVTNADIYVGLDSSMRRAHHYPWNDGPEVTNIFFPIADGNPPKDVAEFRKMIKWLGVQLIAGKLIHIGCIGGHGRTGMVLAAMVKELTGNEDAITYVRGHYCKKAVESPSQVLFLHNEYGIKEVAGSRFKIPSTTTPAKWDAKSLPSSGLRKAPAQPQATLPLAQRPEPPTGRFEAPSLASIMSVWRTGVVTFDKPAKSDKMLVSQEGAAS
jgi:hypothetical protein